MLLRPDRVCLYNTILTIMYISTYFYYITTASLASLPGALLIVTNDPLITQFNGQNPPDNRTGLQDVSLTFVVGHVGDTSTSYNTPSVMWLQNGAPTRTLPNNMPVGSSGRLSTTLSFTSRFSDVGVYQCIFIGSNLEIFGAIPIRVDKGERHSSYFVHIMMSYIIM